MQRQSLGSPLSKLYSHGGDDALISNDPNCIDDDNHDHRKATKPRRFSLSSSSSSSSLSSPPKPEKLVHFIPLLTFLCFLVLYLVSHSPSPSDLAQFNESKRSSGHIDSTETSHATGISELRRADVSAIRSLRNLREIPSKRASPKHRSHRKIADF